MKTKKKLRGRPPKAVQAEYLEHLLAVATEMFLANGYNAISIDGVARQAKVSKLTIYRRFEGKEGLFIAVAERVIREASTFEAVATEGRDPVDVLQDFARATYENVLVPRNLAIIRMVIGEARDFPELARKYYQRTLAALAPLARYLDRLDQEGVLSVPDPLRAALNFTNLSIDGLRLLFSEPLPLEEREAWYASVTRLFMDGYRRRDR